LRGRSHGQTNEVSREVKERAVRMVFDYGSEYDSQWAAITSIAGKLGMSAETLLASLAAPSRGGPGTPARAHE